MLVTQPDKLGYTNKKKIQLVGLHSFCVDLKEWEPIGLLDVRSNSIGSGLVSLSF